MIEGTNKNMKYIFALIIALASVALVQAQIYYDGEEAARYHQQQQQQQHRIQRRQVSYPSPYNMQQPPMAPPPAPQPAGDPGNQVFKFFQDLGPQVERAKAISSLFSSSSSGTPSPNGTTPFGAAGGPMASPFSAAQLMSQFSELIRATQDRSAKALESSQASLQQAGQQTASAAQQAQGGIQSALAEIGQGLQKLAANNPNLLPDIKNLYQSVSGKLSSASSSVAQAANPLPKNGAEQFAEQLAKAGQQWQCSATQQLAGVSRRQDKWRNKSEMALLVF